MQREERGSRSDALSTGDSALAPCEEKWISDITGSNEFTASLSSGTRMAALQLGEAIIVRKANDLVRLALFTEYRRSSLRRDTIMKRTVGKDASRAFAVILAAAQHTLRNTFGFELVEMRPRGAENPLLREQALELDRRSNNKRQRVDETSDSRKSSSSSAQAYCLRSVLPASVRQVLTSVTQDDTPPLIDWSNNTGELGSMGLLYIILSLILLSGRQASEGTDIFYSSTAHLRSCLAQLSLSMDRPLPTSLQSNSHFAHEESLETRRGPQAATLETFFAQLQRQGYLERVRVLSDASSPSYEIRWGARAEVEIGEKAIASFIVELYSDGAKSESESITNELLKRMERAVGTPLVD